MINALNFGAGLTALLASLKAAQPKPAEPKSDRIKAPESDVHVVSEMEDDLYMNLDARPKTVAPLPSKPQPLPISPRATSNATLESNTREQHSNAVPGFKNKSDKQRALARARDAIKAGELKPAVRPVAEFCSVGTRGAQWVITELVDEGLLERTGSGAARVKAKNDSGQSIKTEVIDALKKNFQYSDVEAKKMYEHSVGDTLDERIKSALKSKANEVG